MNEVEEFLEEYEYYEQTGDWDLYWTKQDEYWAKQYEEE